MIPFIQLPCRTTHALEQKTELPSWLVALVLGIILGLQIALLLLVP